MLNLPQDNVDNIHGPWRQILMGAKFLNFVGTINMNKAFILFTL